MPWIFRRPRSPEEVRRQVDEEIDFHLRRKAERIAADEGLSPAEALEEARRRFGDVEGTRRYCAEQSTARERERTMTRWIEELAQDIGYALRTLRKSPTYTGVVVGTLALGIAAGTIVFSVMNPYLVRELPYAEPEELVQLGQIDETRGWDGVRFSMATYEDYRERSRAFEEMGAYYYTVYNLADDEGRPARHDVGVLTANMLDVLGVSPLRGRGFLPGDGGAGGSDVVLLDHGLWKARYGGEPGIVGETIRLDGTPHAVVGIMPPDFVFPWNEVKLWVPARVDPAREERDRGLLMIVGRLAEGWTPERAREELGGVHRQLAAAHPDADGRYAGISVKPLREALSFAWEAVSMGFPILMAAVTFVLLIVCVNVASLTLARATARREEVAVRSALGAGRGRLVRQLVTESGLVAAAGGGLGTLLAWWGVSLLGPVVPETIYRVGEVTLDPTVLAYAAGVTLVTPFLFGLAPALAATRADLAATLRGGSPGEGRGWGRLRGRRALVVAEVALGIVLVTGAGLALRSFAEVRDVELGFDPGRILAATISLPRATYPDPGATDRYFRRAMAEVEALPGVEGAGATSTLPMNHETALRQFAVPGREPPEGEARPLAYHARVSPGYFEAIGIPLVAGRSFRRDEAASGAAVVVSESLARRHFEAGDAVGRTLLIGEPGEATLHDIVGVAADAQQADLRYTPRPQIYRPLDGSGYRRRFLVIAATGGAPLALASPVRGALRAVDPDLPVSLRPMREIVRENTFLWAITSLVLGAFGLFALALASLGIYGVMAYAVERRRREMGIRMALGAGIRGIRRLVVGEGLRLAGIGLVVGLGLAVVAGRLMASVLFGVTPLDPVALAGTLAVFAVVAVGSSWLPARRATRARPAEVLREE